MTPIHRMAIYFGPPKKTAPQTGKATKSPEDIIAEKKGDELDAALAKHKVDDVFVESLKAPIRSHFVWMEGFAIKKFDDSMRMAPWTKMLLTACPKQTELAAEWDKAVPALDLKLGKLNAYRFQVGLAATDPLLKGTALEGVGMKGILEVCWAGKVPEDLKGLVMPKEFGPPSEFPTWTKKNRPIAEK